MLAIDVEMCTKGHARLSLGNHAPVLLCKLAQRRNDEIRRDSAILNISRVARPEFGLFDGSPNNSFRTAIDRAPSANDTSPFRKRAEFPFRKILRLDCKRAIEPRAVVLPCDGIRQFHQFPL